MPPAARPAPARRRGECRVVPPPGGRPAQLPRAVTADLFSHIGVTASRRWMLRAGGSRAAEQPVGSDLLVLMLARVRTLRAPSLFVLMEMPSGMSHF